MASTSAIVVLISLAVQSISGIQVKVKQGLLEGLEEETITKIKYYSFRAIPYAKPPMGPLRFKAPEDPEPWDGVRNATEHGSTCPQLNILTNIYTRGSEDCLFCNVYTTSLTGNKPVIFLIHGGANKFGSGDDALYGPDFLVGDVVLVTINYRLDVLGFFSTGTCDAPGNYALKDQVAALKWVKNNIANFGGDPNKVTILGGTSGGASTTYHLVSPMSKGLFTRAIAMSGVASHDFNYSFQPGKRAEVLALKNGLNSSNATEIVEYLRNVDVDLLVNRTNDYGTVLASEEITDVPFKMQPFTAPVIEPKCPEGNFITEHPYDMILKGNINVKDVMAGYNNHEALLLIPLYNASLLAQFNRYRELFVPSKILTSCTPDKILELSDKIVKYYFGNKPVSNENIGTFIHFASNSSIAYDVLSFLDKWTDGFGRAYAYKFSSYSPVRNVYGSQGAAYGITGASHFDEVPYLCDPKSLNLSFSEDSTDYKMIQHITTSIINFATTGNPSAYSIEWPEYDSKTRAYVNFAEDMTLEYGADLADYLFWKSIFEECGLKI